MQALFDELRKHAQEVATELGVPSFYARYEDEVRKSLHYLNSDETLTQLHTYVADQIEDDFGHGHRHALLVTRDTGALVLILARTFDLPEGILPFIMRCAQAAGLLHDIRRKESNHAAKSAETARQVLTQFLFSWEEIEDIAQAIANHEAFKTPERVSNRTGQLISDCLYDADKFRWGPDNFTDTVWYMASFYNVPIERFADGYDHGIDAIRRIKGSFRTSIGKEYGPEMIDMGLTIGQRVIQLLRSELARR